MTLANNEAIARADTMVNLLVSLIGESAATRIMDHRNLGGRRYAFPKSELGPGAKSYAYLVEVVGANAAKRLCEHFNGDEVYIPKMTKYHRKARNQRIVAAYNLGTSIAELVREFNLSDRQVWDILKTTDMNDQGLALTQRSLF